MNTYSTNQEAIDHYKLILSGLDRDIRVANNQDEVNRIESFRDEHYQTIFPLTFASKPDPYYSNGIHCYLEDDSKNIIATLTFAFESDDAPLPDGQFFEELLSQYKQRGVLYMQIGRMLVDKKHRKKGLAKKLFKLMYYGASAIGIKKIVTLYKVNGLSFVENVIGTRTVLADTGESFGGKHNYAAIEWSIDDTNPEFFAWINEKATADETNNSAMDQYSGCQFALTTSFQMDVYKHTSSLMTGKVLDVGCGSGKVIPWLADNPQVDSYQGVDISAPMIEHAKGLLKNLGRSNFKVLLSDINDIDCGQYDSALCICSYQFWEDQLATLCHIASMLKPDAVFALATPNNKQDLAKLSHEVRKEQPGHPNLESFIAHNLTLEGTTTMFSDVDTVLSQAKQAGFKLRHFDDRFYLGGMDYFIFVKNS